MTIELTEGHYTFMNIGRRYWSADLFKTTQKQRDPIRAYVRSFKDMLAQGTGVYLWGPNGSGKTYIATAMLKYAWSQWRITGYCVTAAELKEAWIEDYPAHADSEESTVERVERVRLLVIDDMGKEHRSNSGYAETQFGALFRRRTRNLLTTIVTSNLNPKEFSSIYGMSTGQLAKESMFAVKLNSVDMRESKAKKLMATV